MKNMKISLKLTVSFLIVVVIAVAVGGVGIVGMNSINRADDDLYQYNVIALDAMGSIRETFALQRNTTRNFILYHSESEQFKSAVTTMRDLEEKMEEYIAEYTATITEEEDKQLFGSFTAIYHNEYKQLKDDLEQFGRQDETEKALDLIDTTGKQIIETVAHNLTECDGFNVEAAKIAVDGNTKLFHNLAIIEVVVLLVAVAVSLFLAFYISGLISKPVNFMKDVLLRIGMKGDLEFSDAEYKQTEVYAKIKDEVGESVKMLLVTIRRLVNVGEELELVAQGDLTAELKLLSEKDTMGLSLQKMVAGLNEMFSEIGAATAQVSVGSRQVADGAQALAQGSTEQAAAVEELSSNISQIAQKTKDNAEMAGRAAGLADTIKQNAEKGSRQMDQMMDAVRKINQASHNINTVIKVIDDIAFQTNILALNAAVEAARAGQHGKGFAVVADEVRNLAAKSAEAAKNTGELIADSMERAELGAKIAEETAVSLADIVSGIGESSQIVSVIAKSSEEQSLGILQVNNGIDQVAQVVQQNSATSEESAAASEEMSGQSSMLEQLIARFKLKKDGGVGQGEALSPMLPIRERPAAALSDGFSLH